MNQPYAVVLAGGSGTRFWPASRRARPKQLLPLGGEQQSLLAATVRRVTAHCPPGHVLISTSEALHAATREVLPMLPADAFLAEPVARNTAPCIAWATLKIAQRDPQAIIAVLPSDHHIASEAAFNETVARAFESAGSGIITTIGITPTRGDTGFGYIEIGEQRGQAGVFRARRFEEKPEQAVADAYFKGGRHLWNSGMFFFRADVLLAAIAQHLPDLHRGLEQIRAASGNPELEQEVTRAVFAAVPSISIDHGLMEKVSEVNVVPGDFGWSDLGSWAALWELADKQQAGNACDKGVIVVNARDNLVRDFSSKSRTVAVVGVDNLCIIQTDDAILVVSRDHSQAVRQVVDRLEAEGLGHLL